MPSILLGAQAFTPTSLVAFLQSRIDAANAVLVAKANWQNASKTYTALNKQGTVVVHDLKQYVIAAFGATSSKLADFGFTPKKVTVLTPEQKAAAAAKRAATRKARNTLGPKAKLAITGTVPSTGSAAPATPAAPAASPAQTAAPATAPQNQAASTAPTAASPAPQPAPTVTVNVTTSAPATAPVTSSTSTATEPSQAAATPASTAGSAPTATTKS